MDSWEMLNITNSTNATSWLLDVIDDTTPVRRLKPANASRAGLSDISAFIIFPYSVIFLLSVVGNFLVILTLIRHKKMRTVTNVFLLNLAVSDLLLAVFCMPFSLVPMLMQEFVFGPVVCILIRYAQAVSVGVSCVTLVAISLERYYAICQPLRSRRWQTLTHAYRVIMAIWLLSAVLMVPIAIFSKVIRLINGAHACREIWPETTWERIYMIVLDVVLLVLPLFLMALSYGRISLALWSEISISNSAEAGSPLTELGQRFNGMAVHNGYAMTLNDSPVIARKNFARSISVESSFGKQQQQVFRPPYSSRVLANKKRVVKMLCVVVLEYFVCWTPLSVLNSWTVFDYISAREHFSPLLKTAILLLAYLSACIHPITYCFMNKCFRQSFTDAFKCCFRKKLSSVNLNESSHVINGVSDATTGRTSVNMLRVTWKRQP